MDGQATRAAVAASLDDDWYEFGFARLEGSRRRGVASMPLPHAQTLLKWAGYVAANDVAGMLVLDPAVGSGNTLLAAAQVLAARARSRRWGAERLAQEIEHGLWGLDPDPIACHVAELRLRRLIAHLVPDLPAARRKAMQLHIHQTDSLVLPADARFHVVVTNPPLATARGLVISHAGFESAHPPRDVWMKFLEQSMHLVGWGGALAIALPEALLTKPSAASLRGELQADWTLARMAHLTGVFRSGPGTVMLLLRRTPPTAGAEIHWERLERLSLKATPQESNRPITIASRGTRVEKRLEGQIAQTDLAPSSRAPWRYALGPAEQAFIKKLELPNGTIGRTRLGDLVTISRGAELVKESPDPTATPLPGAVALLRGMDVAPFHAQPGRYFLPTAAFKQPVEGWRGPKLILPRLAPWPMAAYDDSAAVPLNALMVLQAVVGDPDPATTLTWLLAMLNCPPLRAYVALMQTAYTLARPTIDLEVLRALPIALGTAEARARLSGLAQELSRHFTQFSGTPDDELHYPITHRLQGALALEFAALYQLDAEDLAVSERWGSATPDR